MESLEGADVLNGVTGDKFPAADIAGDLNPGQNQNFEVDPTSSNISTSLQIKNLKSAIIVSAVVAAVAGAIFALTKKLREK
ncbi:hypothetical protein JRO89_XS15G0113200 [Xanthoceras sorbifolium]|uniref:Uncharacterized protein n=1 Tax=Xanthoceras sorbifolium TaxID=99658 RepID=A0ABQ8H1S5_9ROSI|nr:hypothetical protein JRO89_XS15G0113200 [Xanthoceras sorbifolium]